MQRLADILLSLAGLLVLAPLFAVVAVVLRLTGEGDVFYRQQRVGRGGEPFGLIKFATMLRNSPSIGTGTITLRNDPRVLPVGRFLRKTKINELPQLVNVLRGEMSLVGPRPQTPRCFAAFPERSRACIVQVRPGLTGIGSLVFRDEEELMHESRDPDAFYDSVIMPYKGLLEEWYVANASPALYLKLVLLTGWIVAGGSRSSQRSRSRLTASWRAPLRPRTVPAVRSQTSRGRSSANFSTKRSTEPMNRCGASMTSCSVSSIPDRCRRLSMTRRASPRRSSVTVVLLAPS